MELDIESVPDGRAQRRMGSREQDAAAELHLEVDEFAQEHLLIDARLPDVVSLRPRLGELHVLGTHREDDAVGAAQIVVRQDFDFAELGAHAEMPGLGAAPEDRAVQKIRRSDEVGDELAARPLVDFARRADLLDVALVHHRDRVRQGERLALVVGHVHGRDPEQSEALALSHSIAVMNECDRASASLWSWVTYTVVIRSSRCRRFSSKRMRSRSFASRLESGSSSRSSCGSITSARASARRCCCPPESLVASRSASSSSCTALRTRRTLSRISCLENLRSPTSSGKAAFWKTFMCGQMA